jgi:hypothetical protein
MITTDTHVYFYSGKEIYSNWHRCQFIDPITGFALYSTEQAFMWYKADFFKDDNVRDQILNERDPKATKELGRLVRCYHDKAWECVRLGYMAHVNLMKFSQNTEFAAELLSTGDRILVEASPYDGIWGVKLAVDDPLILDKANWKGRNLLGEALMTVRGLLKS